MWRWLMTMAAVGVLALPAAATTLEPEQAEQLAEAQRLYEQERYAEAAETLETLIEEVPALADAHRLLGHAYYGQGRPDEARAALRQAIRHGGLSEDVLGRLVEIDLDAGRRAAALEALRLLAVLSPGDRQSQVLRADLLAERGATAEAAAIYDDLLDTDAANAELWARLSQTHLQAKRLTDAAAALEQAYRLGDVRAELTRALAAVWFEQGHLPQALRWHELAMRAGDAATADDHLRRAELLIALDDVDRAEPAARAALDAATDNAQRGRAESLLGWIADARGDAEAAAIHFGAALRHGVADPQMVAAVATYHYNAGAYGEAASVIRRYGREPRSRQMHRLLVMSLFRSNAATRNERRAAVRGYVEQHGVDDDVRTWIARLAE